MRKSPKFYPELVERAVRLEFEAKNQFPSQWAAIESIAGKIGCTAQTLWRRVRQGELQQLADLVLFLCSDSASSITGAALPVDGGWTAR